MKSFLLWVAFALFIVGALVSVVGGPWDTYAHHTAFTGFAEAIFVASFLPFNKRNPPV